MSTSPLPPDPYEALGVSRDCDSDTIKKAHRKLVLKHHPDRIKDPALVEYNKNEFQKVQQAYELLIDPASRLRYENECKLAQLRRERMTSEPPRPTYTKTTYTAPRPSPVSTNSTQREHKPESGYAYEEREPDSPWIESTSRGFDDRIPQANVRKGDSYERRTSHSKPVERKDNSRAGQWVKPRAAPVEKPMSMRTVFAMAGMAQAAKSRVKEKEKELHAKAAKVRDREEHSARDQKNANTKQHSAYVEDDDSDDESSGSDRETVVAPGRSSMRDRSPAQRPRHNLTPEPSKTKRQSSPRPELRPSTQQSPRPEPRPSKGQSPPPRSEVRSSRGQSPPPRPPQRPTRQSSSHLDPKPAEKPLPRPEARPMGQPPPRSEPRASTQASPRPDQRSVYDDDSQDDDKYERHFRNAQGYQFTATRKDPRPTLSRQGSDIRDYWQADTSKDRKSGSDSDKQRPSSSHRPSRRSMPDDSKLRPPMPTQSSAPAGVRAVASQSERDPSTKSRSRNNSYISSSHRREMMPELKRSGSDPVPQKAPVKRDSVPLKGSSLKQTESIINHDSGYASSSNPHTPEHGGESPHRVSSTKYRVGKEEDGPRARKMAPEDGAPLNRFLSPPDQPHHHHHHHRSESRERRGSRSREREPEVYRRSGSNRPAHPERRPSFSRNESSSRYEERDRSRNIRVEKSPDRGEGYFRHWDGPTKQSKTKAPNYQDAHIPNYSKFYHEPTSSPSSFPRSAQQPRRPSGSVY